MSEMIERVDAAIKAELEAKLGMIVVNLNLGAIAIKAMRKPDKHMIHAAAKAMSPGRRPTPERVSVAEKHAIRYRAMIDAALTDTEKR